MSQLHQLDKEKLKRLQELNRHLVLPNVIVKKRELCCNMWRYKGGDSRTRAVTDVKDVTKPVSVPALGPRQWSVV